MCGDFKGVEINAPENKKGVIAELATYYINYDFALFSEMFMYYSGYKLTLSDILEYIISSLNNNVVSTNDLATLNNILAKQKEIDLTGLAYKEIKKVHLPERDKIQCIIKNATKI